MRESGRHGDVRSPTTPIRCGACTDATTAFRVAQQPGSNLVATQCSWSPEAAGQRPTLEVHDVYSASVEWAAGEARSRDAGGGDRNCIVPTNGFAYLCHVGPDRAVAQSGPVHDEQGATAAGLPDRVPTAGGQSASAIPRPALT
jgi:hypothetical protein